VRVIVLIMLLATVFLSDTQNGRAQSAASIEAELGTLLAAAHARTAELSAQFEQLSGRLAIVAAQVEPDPARMSDVEYAKAATSNIQLLNLFRRSVQVSYAQELDLAYSREAAIQTLLEYSTGAALLSQNRN
jgi:hypothetical protein